MARPSNPYSGTYAPTRSGLSKEEFIKGLKGLKIRAPNRAMSGAGYKSGLPKEHESTSDA